MTKLIQRLAGMGVAKTRLRPKLFGPAHSGPARLLTVADFGANPGRLGMRRFVPEGLAAGAPLVVVLHGCQQDAEGYDAGTGWSQLAARHGFALLYPAQQTANNPMNCFKWYEPGATARQGGEVESILAMVARMQRDHAIDPSRIFVTGLSAGGAMASSLLASAPDVFAGGAIIAGLPHGAAASVGEALQVMRQPHALSPAAWGDKVRSAHGFTGRRPSVSIWHGTADTTVVPDNAEASLAQWANVLGLESREAEFRAGAGHTHRLWRDETGGIRLEAWSIAGMAHGTPIAPHAANAAQRLGAPAPYILDAGLASTWHIAEGWGLLDTPARMDARPAQPTADAAPADPAPPESGVTAVIHQALRAAGLMK